MKYRVLVQPRAAAEIEEAYLWIAERAPESAVNWFNGLDSVIESLETFPERCPHAPESNFFQEEIRQLVYGKRIGRYRILFTIDRDTVYILHVRHGARKRLEGPGDERNLSEEN
jgi:plasmid stabilization system protein ParE